MHLARHLHLLCESNTRVAFLCCPTAYVAFQHTKYLEETRLLEYDQRFAALATSQFVRYDLDEPDLIPTLLEGSVDIAIVDPPYLKDVSISMSLPCLSSIYLSFRRKRT